MKKLIAAFAMIGLMAFGQTAMAQDNPIKDSVAVVAEDTATEDTAAFTPLDELVGDELANAVIPSETESGGIHKVLKTMFVEGTAGFMSLVALALVLGLAFCIERLIYLTLSEINTRRLLTDIEQRLESGDADGARELCRNTRGPVASICYQGLLHMHEPIENVERSMAGYGGVQTAKLEKGCSWIKLFIAIAPSLGFLGTVIGMVMAFDQIQNAGDISPTIVASGMKVALITTIFGIIVAVVLQLFYSYILTKIDSLTTQMEEAAVTLLDIITKHKLHADG